MRSAIHEAVGQASHVCLALKHLQKRSMRVPTASAASAQRGTLTCMRSKCLESGDKGCTKAASHSNLLRPSRLENMALTLDHVSAVSHRASAANKDLPRRVPPTMAKIGRRNCGRPSKYDMNFCRVSLPLPTPQPGHHTLNERRENMPIPTSTTENVFIGSNRGARGR